MEEKRRFSIFNSHLDLAHTLWAKLPQPGDFAIDATCGNGHDTLALTHLFEGVIGLDIQPEAIAATKALLSSQDQDAHLFQQSHETFPSLASEVPIRLIVYNLGYLPGGDKGKTTKVSSTLKSVERSLDLLLPGGMVSITCYPGHAEGKKEQEALLREVESLSPKIWSVSHHTWANRRLSPSLIIVQRNYFNP